MQMNIALFGGTFNPPHSGHSNIIEIVTEKIVYDKLVIMPCYMPPHKTADTWKFYDNRFEMLELLYNENKKIEVSDFEIRNKNVSYTYYTLKHIFSIYNAEKIFIVIGSDNYNELNTWHRIDEILSMNICFFVVSRTSYKFRETEIYLKNRKKFIFYNEFDCDISSSLIRKFIAENNLKNAEKYLDKKVFEYIIKRL
jgi:nicotinate-nucleotide adenylyltransferase